MIGQRTLAALVICFLSVSQVGCATCKKFVKYQGSKLAVSGVKVPTGDGKTVEVASFTIDPQYRDATAQIQQLDLTQYQICSVLKDIQPGPQKTALQVEYVKALIKINEIGSNPQAWTGQPAVASSGVSTPPVPSPAPPSSISEEAKGNLDWCIGNTGAPDCPLEYARSYAECLSSGNRSCLLRKAIDSAKAGDCANAFRLALMCQCHNPGAQKSLGDAGQEGVCSYLKAK